MADNIGTAMIQNTDCTVSKSQDKTWDTKIRSPKKSLIIWCPSRRRLPYLASSKWLSETPQLCLLHSPSCHMLGFCLMFNRRLWSKKIQFDWRRQWLKAEEANQDGAD